MAAIFQIIHFTRRFWKWYLVMAFFVITMSLLTLAVPLLSKQVVDIIVAEITGKKGHFNQVFIFLGAIIAVDIAVTILTAVGQWLGDIFSVRLQTFLSEKFYEHLLGLHMGFYDNEITGQIVNKMYRGITSIIQFLQNMLNNFLPFFLTAFVTIILLSRYSLLIALLLTILFPIYVLISHKSSLDWQKKENKKNELNDFSQGRAFESFAGIRVVKAFVSEAIELKSYSKYRAQIEVLSRDQTKKWHFYDFLRRLCLNLILFGIYAYVVYFTFNKKYTLGEMTLLLQLVNQARFPLFAMSFILGQIQQANAGSTDFFKVMAEKNMIKDAPTATKLVMPQKIINNAPLIKFDNVNFGYDIEKIVLNNINFEVFAGQKLALVGESGEGKSTIVNLLLRFYEPQTGKIFVNGQDIKNVTQVSLRAQMAIVFQDALLFSGSVKENIAYGKPGASLEEVMAAARAANAHDFIQELPRGYNSLVGERGVKLSGGQKQRISIARAILKNAPIVILDEATSSLDSQSEILVQRGLDRLLENRTSLIIAHRLSTIGSADKILVLEKGQVGQCGAPQELLLNKKGLYARLIALQQSLLTATPEERELALRQFDLVE